ncbi:MAG: MFS transporter [Hungatella hathewayi]|nr:MFS transporter [Hungatella hathewayi]
MNITKYKYYPWLLVICYSLLGIFFPAAVTQFSMVVNDLAAALKVDSQVVLLADTTRAVCLVGAMFLSSYVYQHLGLRKTMALGLMFQILPQFLIPLTVRFQCVPLLFLFKGMQGLNSMAFPLYISTITLWMDKRYTALATAVFNGSFVAGSGVGAWIAGKIVPALGWEAAFWAVGGICLFFAIPVLVITRDKKTEDGREQAKGKRSQKGNVYGSIIRQPVTWLLVLALIANTWVGQAVTVDMSVYANGIGYNYGQTGNLMLAVSFVTVVSSILAGGVSDWFAMRTKNKVRCRSLIMGAGYALSMAAAAALPRAAVMGFLPMAAAACSMMFGVSWAAGVFWALPVAIYSRKDHVAGTAFCSGASNIPNPVAPMVVGVLLGSYGHWTAGWMTCAIVSVISLVSSVMLAGYKER